MGGVGGRGEGWGGEGREGRDKRQGGKQNIILLWNCIS